MNGLNLWSLSTSAQWMLRLSATNESCNMSQVEFKGVSILTGLGVAVDNIVAP